ncbi:hypothetical protein VCR17J2_350609 [Vibrio coralliirubri]|nr:hypothetical protein VCR17J2_350609 [Vibrio coralliirubri]
MIAACRDARVRGAMGYPTIYLVSNNIHNTNNENNEESL